MWPCGEVKYVTYIAKDLPPEFAQLRLSWNLKLIQILARISSFELLEKTLTVADPGGKGAMSPTPPPACKK